MRLTDYEFKISYRSGDDDLIRDFYIPALSKSTEYCRAVGFFSNSLLNSLGKGLFPFIKNSGKMKLICGVHISEKDINEINKGYILKRNMIENLLCNSLLFEIDKLHMDYLDSSLSNICWMVANNRLEIKIALKNLNGSVKPGLYHEKIAIFKDKYSNSIATNGSANETGNAYLYNFEYFDVFRSWGSLDENARVKEKVEYFNSMWSMREKDLLILDFPSALKEKLIKIAPNAPIDDSFVNKAYSFQENSQKVLIKEAEALKPRDYQKDAIDRWVANEYKGILEMATGTGKTYTSLFAVKKYIETKNKNSLLIICCPYQHLVDQWECNVNDIFPNTPTIKCYASIRKWYEQLNRLIQDIILGTRKLAIVITTTATGSSEDFISIVNMGHVEKVIICDEVHNIGSQHNKNFLKIDSAAKIGLSATPIRRFDEEGNRLILDYFGEPVYKLGIKKAIEMGFLVEYNYFLTYCDLDEIEYEEYREISKKIARLYSTGNSMDEEALQTLLMKRSAMISSCSGKIDALRRILQQISDYKNMLVYTAENPEFFLKTLNVLEQRGIITLKITSEIPNNLRLRAINKLANRDIDCILAMRCLDEGVDIPTADKAIILASSTNSKQYIQRRGRILRKDKKSGKRIANIYDILVIPPDFSSEIDKKLFERELYRILEFAFASRNYLQVISEMMSFSNKNSLMKNFINIFREFEV